MPIYLPLFTAASKDYPVLTSMLGVVFLMGRVLYSEGIFPIFWKNYVSIKSVCKFVFLHTRTNDSGTNIKPKKDGKPLLVL